MKRICSMLLCRVAVVALAAANIGRAVGSELDGGFHAPPMEARSRTWWHWQNGFLNADQMERELKFMREAGLGGCQQFVAGWVRIPTNGEHLVRFMSDEWLGFSRRALKAASDNGLEYGLQNGAGWTGVGGPWMTTEKSMKHVFAVERRTLGGKSVVLPPLGKGQYKPGGFVNDGRNKPWYGDIRSFAFPTPKAYVCGDLPRPRASGVPSEGDMSWLLERNTFRWGMERKKPAFKFSATGNETPNPSLRFDWDEKVTVRAVWLKGTKNTEDAEVWASDDGKDFRFVAKLSSGYVSFEDMFAGRYHAIPKTVCCHIELRWSIRPCTLQIYEVGFSSRPTLTGFDDQCGRYSWNPFVRRRLAEDPDANLDPKDVVDITGRIAADGTLEFTPPDDGREWTVLRIAATSTRRTNQPTNPDMAGPACDILDADAIRFHLSQYIGKMLEAEKAVGAHTIGNVLLDSWEQGTANWSKCLPDEFRKRRGYDLAKYLPVFGGYFVGSRETSERFLWDFRKTVTEVVKDNFFGVMSEYCRQHGLKHYVEGFACGSGTCSGDPLMAYFNCDVPMTEAGPSVREASSAAHLKGGKLVAMEAHTSAADWSRTPRDFKRGEDSFFRHGITRIIYHGGAHNPKSEWRFPGLTFGGYGAEIAPGQTWAKYMSAWQDYLARCQFMLRRGAFVADVLAFAGEDYGGQVVGVYEEGRCGANAADRDRLKGLPPGLDYDLVNAEFLKELSVFGDGRIGYAGNPDATRYRALVLREQDFEMSVETVRELKRLVNGGAMVVGPKIVKSLGCPENAAEADAEVAAIGEELARSGRCLSSIASLRLKPDFVARNARVGEDVNYLHRRDGETDIYYVTRWNHLGGDAKIGFRVTGKIPEVFDPMTGEIAEAEEFSIEDGYTYLPAIPCDAAEATRFVVFRKPTGETVRTAPSREKSVAALNPEWTIHFRDELGVDKTVVTNSLFDWSSHADPDIATFSGTAVYRANVSLPPSEPGAKSRLRLGKVEELCEVIVDGKSCGVVWCEPYEVDVTDVVKGRRSVDLEIRVVNSWHNRLLADQKRPEGERKTFTIRPPKSDAKPVAGGLLGPLSLVSIKRRNDTAYASGLVKVELPPLFGDHAVLQRGPATGVWGTANPGEKVEVSVSSARATAITGTNGWWHAKLDLADVGDGPHELRVQGAGSAVVSKDVLVGDVWLASGQSNMEMKFVTSLFGTVFGAEALWKRSAGRPIRVFHKNLDWSMERGMNHQRGHWIMPTPEDLANCTAVGFSFIEAVQREVGGPVALVDIAVGGTRTMQWTAHERLVDSPTWHAYWTNQIEQIARQDFFNKWKSRNGLHWRGYDYGRLMKEKWKRGSLPTDVPRGVTYYRTRVPVPQGFMEKGVSAMTTFWLRGFKTTRCSLSWFKKDRGWVNGESLLQEGFVGVHGDRKDSLMRLIDDGEMEVLFRVEAILPDARIEYDSPRIVKWEKTAQIDLPLDGWEVFEETRYPPLPANAGMPKPFKVPQARIENFYNSMVYPFRHLTFRGAIWYQGCSDACFADNVHEYPVWFKVMVDNWRETFDNGCFPFYWCQLAGYGGPPDKPGTKCGQAEIREAQRRSRRIIENGEMAVIYDTGEAECHGRDKIPAGERLARIALARDYGRTNIVYRSADFAKKKVVGGELLLSFETYGSALAARPVRETYSVNCSSPARPFVRHSANSQLEGFEVRDREGVWRWANAQIVDAATVRVWADGVADPVEARYNWGGLGAGNLWNEGGLPVSPFTTED